MATAKPDSFDGFIGKVGDTVTYFRNGKIVRRKIGKSTKASTVHQLACRQQTPITNDFITPVNDLIKTTFKTEAQLQKKSPRDLISSYTRIHAIKGEYPNQEIDFTKVLFSQGKMPATPGTQVSLSGEGIEFSWDPGLITGQFRKDDQAVLVAYFPESKTAEFTVNGGPRSKGNARLDLVRNSTPTLVETYIAFLSADHKKVSNSIYTGQLILPAHNINQ